MVNICMFYETFLQTNSFKNMLKKKKIIAISNYFIKELVAMLEDEGLEINRLKTLNELKN